jgi:hypothetical protein
MSNKESKTYHLVQGHPGDVDVTVVPPTTVDKTLIRIADSLETIAILLAENSKNKIGS